MTARVACLLTASRLFDTLVANLVRYQPDTESPIVSAADDAPRLERDADARPVGRAACSRGWLDYLTWQPRAIRLLRDDDGRVRHCLMHQHLKLSEPPPLDPHTPYRIDPKRGREPLRVRSGRALWRDADAIALGLLPERDTNPNGVLAWGASCTSEARRSPG